MKQIPREDRVMHSQTDLENLVELEAGRKLTQTEKWFVWVHPRMKFSEIREMLDKESEQHKEIQLKNQKPNWPAFG